MPRTRPFPLLAIAACAAGFATPAHAAYAPRVAVAVDPPAAGAPVALALTVTQAAGDEATRSIRVALPEFGRSATAGRAACTTVDAAAGTCPAASRAGSAASDTSFGAFSGGIFFAGAEGERANLAVTMSSPLLPLALQRFSGALTPAELTFDDVPGPATTRLRLALDEGLVTAPARCGDHELLVRLTSHGGETVERRAAMTIGACPGDPPAIAATRLVPRRLRAGRTSALAFTLAERAAVRITARRAGTRRVRTLRRLTGQPGRNTVRGVGRGLAPGRWLVTVRATDADGATARTLPLTVLTRRS